MNSWFLLYVAGSMQAALLALALWQRRGSSHASRLLAGWMALLVVDLGVRAWAQTQLPLVAFKPMLFVGLFPFLHGSLFYLYARTVIHDRPLRISDARHGLGFLLVFLVVADLFLMAPNEALTAIRRSYAAGFGGRNAYMNIGLFAYSLSYIAAALLAIRRHRDRLRATRSDSHPDALRWLVVMAVSQCVIWAVALGNWTLPSNWIDQRLTYVAVAAWVLLVGYYRLLNGGALSDTLQPDVGHAGADADDGDAAAAVDFGTPSTRAKSENITPLDDPRADDVAARLQQLMQDDALYREPTLTIARLARRSGYPEYLISAVINRRFGCPFWDYVNGYRVAAARACLLDLNDARTVLEIAYACGFTSKSTFNAAFKRLTAETPSACRARAAGAPMDASADTLPSRTD